MSGRSETRPQPNCSRILQASHRLSPGDFSRNRGASKNKDLAHWLVRIHVARPGLITKENSPKLLEAAKVAESPWTEPMTAAIHYRLGDLKQAEPLLTKANGDSQFQALAAMLPL